MTSFPFIRRLAQFSGATGALVFAWKIILLLFTAQPIPANDAFFFDGAVVNFLLNGHYCNPSLIMVLPFSAAKIYCAYPPLYQAVLLPWMAVFGTSVLSAMWFHLAVFGLFLLTLLAIFRRLQTPAWCVNLAGLFLFAITFDDRPDGLAQLFGMLALYAWVRSLSSAKNFWPWLATVLVVLTLATNPEVGGLYFGWLWLLTLGAAWLGKRKFPLAPMIALVILPPALVAGVKFGRPDLWAGFLEHATRTPSLKGFHKPLLEDFLKVGRTIPGTFFVAAILLVRLARGQMRHDAENHFAAAAFLNSAVPLSLGMTFGSLFIFTPNWIQVAGYFQPLVVGCFLMLENGRQLPPQKNRRLVSAASVALALFAAIRAIGISTWGVACAADKNYFAALKIVRDDLNATPPGATVVMSSAFLYEAMRHPEITVIHEDWTHGTAPGLSDNDAVTQALQTIRPRELILTQFGYYRRYQPVLEKLRSQPGLVEIKITNAARTPPPDAFKSWQRVVQHISWAPVIVEFSWKPPVTP